MGVRGLINFIYNLIIELLQRVWKLVSDIQIMAIAVAIGTAGTQLCGERFWAVLFLSYAAVFADTLTKWIAITKRFYQDNNLQLNTWRLILNILFHGPAWAPGYLESRKLGRILEKLLMYTMVIMLCHAGGKWLPVLDLFGLVLNPANVFPASASIGVFLIEFKSINENLKEMGQTGISDMLSNIFNIIVAKFTPKV